MTLLTLALAYLVGMNVFLRTRLLRDVLGSDPDSLLVDYTSAYSVWPGHIHVEGLSIRGRDSHVEWMLRLDRCTFDVAFSDFVHRKFRAGHVRGDGLSLRLRRRVDQVTPETMSALPPVPGFLDPPLADVGPPPPPLTDETYNLWSVQLDDVIAAHVREVWVDTTRYSGDLEVRGRWVFRPLRWLDVGPATIDARPLDVSFGMVEPWLSGVEGRLDVTVHPFDLGTIEGTDIVDQISVRADLRGTAWGAQMANRATGGQSVEITGAVASFVLHADVDHGVLEPGTRLDTDPFDARATAAGVVFEASLQAELDVGAEGVAHAHLGAAAARISAGGQERARAEALTLALTSRDLDLAKNPFSDPSYAVEVRGAETRSLDYWCSYLPLPSGMRVASGRLTVAGRLEGAVRARAGRGHVEVGVSDLEVVAGRGDVVRGNLTGAVHVDGSLESKLVDLSGSEVSLREVRATVRGVSVRVPSLDARTRGLTLTEGAGVTGRISLDAPLVELPSIASLGPLLSLPNDVALEGGRASARVHLDIDLPQRSGAGEVAVAAHDLKVRVGAERLQGDLTVALTAKRDGAATDLSGSRVAFRSTGAAGTLDWWADVRLEQATLRVSPRPRFSTTFRAASKDGSPLTALVADNTAIPRWLIEAVSTRSLEATGALLVTPSVLAVRSVNAHARGVDVALELAKIRGRPQEWALLVDLGIALAGIDVTEGRTQVLLFGARPWFQAKVAALEALEHRGE
jgi:hypothetical protein